MLNNITDPEDEGEKFKELRKSWWFRGGAEREGERERERQRQRQRVSSMTVTKLINLCRRAYRLNIHGLVNPTHTPFINAALQN